MYVSEKNKVILLWNPKTGSSSLHGYLKLNVPDSFFGPRDRIYPERTGHWHMPLVRIVQNAEKAGINIGDLQTWKIGVFWRDPIDRTLSGLAWGKRTHPETIRPDMSVTEYIVGSYSFVDQRPFLTDKIHTNYEPNFPHLHLNWTWFNYHDYTNEFKRLAEWFGLSPTDADIPHHQSAEGNRLYVEDLTADEIRIIKERYWDDYELLESRGIFAPTRDL